MALAGPVKRDCSLAENTASFEQRLNETANAVEAALSQRLADNNVPAQLAKAMAHGTLNGGKRLRPYLVIQTAGLFGISQSDAMPTAIALECIHCYSLIHDDLPAMDDDDIRRGQPSVHKAFDEATAILAGDSLLPLAFEILGHEDTHSDPAIRIDLVIRLAKAAGAAGMAGGQMLDLEAETKTLNEAEIRRLQLLKTGALILFGCESGGILAGASKAELASLGRYGRAIGAAFQIKDDLLDIESTPEVMGKAVGKDEAAGKATLVTNLGPEQARLELDAQVDEAMSALEIFGDRADILRDLARYMKSREK